VAEIVNIPRLGVSMTEGTIIRWLVATGDRVEIGTPLYLLESNKAEVEVESSVGGVIVSLAQEGETYPVGAQIAEIDPHG